MYSVRILHATLLVWMLHIAEATLHVSTIEGEKAVLPCYNITSDSNDYEWFIRNTTKENKVVHLYLIKQEYVYSQHLLREKNETRASIDKNTGDLTIFSTRLTPVSDEHLYICKKPGGNSYAPVNLTVNVLPDNMTISGIPDNIKAGTIVGNATCTVERIKPASTSMVIWKLNKNTIKHTIRTEKNNGAFRLISTAFSFTFSPGKEKQSVECHVNHEQLDKPKTLEKYINVTWAPFNSTVSNKSEQYPGSDLTLTCSYEEGNPKGFSHVKWTNNGQEMKNNYGNNGLVLTLRNISVDDNGIYECFVSNSVGEGEPLSGNTVKVYNTHKVTIDGTYPAYVTEGEKNVKIQCSASGGIPNQILSVYWEKDGKILSPENTLWYEISEVKKEDAGDYTCRVQNFDYRTGWASSQPYYLDVKYPPLWKGSSIIGGTTGKQLTITCNVDANPSPNTWIWTRQGKPIGSFNGITDYKNGSITITEVSQTHFGNYSCKVKNGIGKSHEFNIKVVAGEPPYQPENFAPLKNITSKTVTLQWHPGFDGGFPQTFTLQYKKTAEINYKPFKDGIKDTRKNIVITVTELEPETAYDFRVKSENKKGNSSYVNITGITKVSPVIKISETILEAHKMTVKWTKPKEDLRSDNNHIKVVVKYKKVTEDKYTTYPMKVNVEEQHISLYGTFDEESNYDIKLLVYEGNGAYSFEDKTTHVRGDNTYIIVTACVVIILAGLIITVSLALAYVVFIKHKKGKSRIAEIKVRKESNTYLLFPHPEIPHLQPGSPSGQDELYENMALQHQEEEDTVFNTRRQTESSRDIQENGANGTNQNTTNLNDLYAQPDKTKKKKKKQEKEDMNELYAQPDKKKKKKKTDTDGKKGKKPLPQKPGKPHENVRKADGNMLSGARPDEETYENVGALRKGRGKVLPNPSHAEETYENIDIRKKRPELPPDGIYANSPTPDLIQEVEHIYGNMQEPKVEEDTGKSMGPDGTIYTSVSFVDDGKPSKKGKKEGGKQKIRRAEESTEYAFIDYNAKAPCREEEEVEETED